MKKIASVLLAVLLIATLSVPALAASPTDRFQNLLGGSAPAASQQTKQTVYTANDKTPINAQVCVKPQRVEMKDGKLIARCYVINGMYRPVWIMGKQTIAIFANGKKIAQGEADIPQDEEYSIDPGKCEIEEFTLTGSEFDKTASLENLRIDSLITYAWDDE